MSDPNFDIDDLLDNLFAEDPDILALINGEPEPAKAAPKELPYTPPPAPPEERPEDLPSESNEPTKGKKVLKIVFNVMFYAVVAVILYGALTFATDDNPKKSLFGYRYYEILTSSMQSVYPQGSVVFVKLVEPEEIKVGDDITFYRDINETTITHRVIEIIPNSDAEGNLGFRTKGTDNRDVDKELAYGYYTVGVVTFHIPYLASFINYLIDNIVITIVLGVLAIVLIVLIVSLIKDDDKKGKKKPKKAAKK